ncbi:XRE family transcriptional regulator [Labrys neptuniae]
MSEGDLQTIGERLRWARENAGMTQQVAADALGISKSAVSQWERNQTEPSTENLREAAKIYQVLLHWLMEGGSAIRDPSAIAATAGEGRRPPLPPRQVLPAPNASQIIPIAGDGRGALPILGLARGGIEGRFLFNGQVVDYRPMPSELANVPDAYGVYVDGESMKPRWKPGELLLIHPHLPPRREDDVLVQVFPDDEHAPPEGYVKEFRAWTPKKLILWQWNPPEEFEIDRPLVKSVHVIVGSRRA